MDSRPALITVLVSMVIITVVAFLAVYMTDLMQKEQQRKEGEIAPVRPAPEPAGPARRNPSPRPQEDEPKKDPAPEEQEPSLGEKLMERAGDYGDPDAYEDEIPSFGLTAVRGEPDLPMRDTKAEEMGFVTLPRGGYAFSVRHPVHHEEVRGVAVPGMVLMDRGLIEFFGCAEGSGKDHETIVRLKCDIMELDMGLRMANLRKGPIPMRLGDPKVPQGSRVLVFVRWKAGDKMRTFHAEDLVINVKRSETMPRVGWTYQGGWMEVDNPSTPGRTKSKVLAASVTRLLLSTWRTTTALLDNPLPDAIDPDTYFANHDVLPAPGTKVLIYFRNVTDAERGRLLALERKYAD
ncbi:MAG: YdjY domain-containing protein [Planctomycetota bacterium]|jgi:hypothetical protein